MDVFALLDASPFLRPVHRFYETLIRSIHLFVLPHLCDARWFHLAAKGRKWSPTLP
ncbi:hypothetical protein [Chelativorans intermedius]|uniref:Uncharacterized protein n=1 Tax=Chelativorans intermedius TaxID=515947 RepID=A0ABV6DA38_9HYPH|nr:hypothetical protein [Chelativorans intermedius]MCT8999696.1 hypothetical protein [Chelativorans intermedius]